MFVQNTLYTDNIVFFFFDPKWPIKQSNHKKKLVQDIMHNQKPMFAAF